MVLCRFLHSLKLDKIQKKEPTKKKRQRSARRNRMSYASAVGARAARKGPDKPPHLSLATPNGVPLTIPRPNCFRLVNSPSTTSLADVAIAFEAQYPSFRCQPLYLENQILLQFDDETDATVFEQQGLKLGDINYNLSLLVNSSNTSIIHLRVAQFFFGANGTTLLEALIQPYGKKIKLVTPFHPNTRTPTGQVDILLDLGTNAKVPPAKLRLDRGTWSEDIVFEVIGNRKFCHFCRLTTHLRKDCPTAPSCNNCHLTTHPDYFCPTVTAKQLPPTAKNNKNNKNKQQLNDALPPIPTTPSTPSNKRHRHDEGTRDSTSTLSSTRVAKHPLPQKPASVASSSIASTSTPFPSSFFQPTLPQLPTLTSSSTSSSLQPSPPVTFNPVAISSTLPSTLSPTLPQPSPPVVSHLQRSSSTSSLLQHSQRSTLSTLPARASPRLRRSSTSTFTSTSQVSQHAPPLDSALLSDAKEEEGLMREKRKEENYESGGEGEKDVSMSDE